MNEDGAFGGTEWSSMYWQRRNEVSGSSFVWLAVIRLPQTQRSDDFAALLDLEIAASHHQPKEVGYEGWA